MNIKIQFLLFFLSILLNVFYIVCENPESYESDDYTDHSENDCLDKNLIGNVRKLHEEGRDANQTDANFDIEANIKSVFHRLFSMTKRNQMEFFEQFSDIDLGLSPKCAQAYSRILTGFKNTELWAIRFFDSMANFLPSGFIEGVFADFGEYDECLNMRSPVPTIPIIKGQYCLAKLILPFPKKHEFVEPELEKQDLSSIRIHEDFDADAVTVRNMIDALNILNGTIYRMGVCLPSVCSQTEVENMINKLLYPIIRLPVQIAQCKTKDQIIQLDYYQYTSLIILGLFSTLVIFGTIIDVYNNIYEKEVYIGETKSPVYQLVQSFSLINNIKSLFAESNAKYATLDTIRLILILNAHLVHAYLLTYTLGVGTLKKITTYALPRFFTYSRYIIVKSPLMIDALFTLSGYLMSFTLLRKLDQTNGRFNYLIFIFQNWLRFVLLVFGSILFYFIAPLLEDGPVWDTATDLLTTGCKNPWNLLKIFLFVNNFQEFQVETFNLKCNITLWFMSSLLQFLIISPIFIILYYKKPKIGLIVIFCSIIVSLFITISPFLMFNIKPWHQILSHGIQMLSTELNHSVNWFHTTPNVHIISYLIGICFGFLFNSNTKLKISEKLVKILWISSVLGILFMYYWNDTFWKGGNGEPQISVLLWHTIGKVMFSTSFGWIYFACSTGRGGQFNRILSARLFQPISRLSFGIYLLHYMVVIRRIFIVKQTVFINDPIMFENLAIDLFIDIFFAFIFYLLIESPFSNIFRLIFGQKVRQNKNEKIRTKL